MQSSSAVLTALAGLGFGLSLIIAIGAQNAFVLRQGLQMEHVAAVVVVCAVSDAVLIVAGVAGAGAVLGRLPWLLDVIRFAGAAFLFGYALLAARRARRGSALITDTNGSVHELSVAITTCLALTWLNPHVYLDTVVLLGSIASTHGEDRWWFAGGAIVASFAWFGGLGYGARLLRPVFAKAAAWRILDASIALVMTVLAVSLLLSAG